VDLGTLEAWWRQWPDANICTPIDRSFWVVDEDPRSNGDQSLRDLQQQHGALPDTLTSHSGGGGRHLYWALPSGRTVVNKINIGTGLDILAAGACVVLPTSVHPVTGNTYESIPLLTYGSRGEP
jgi:hypothetical protein